MSRNIFLIGIRLPSTRLLGALSLFAVALSLVRMAVTGRSSFGFLNWNLFLAFVPWFLSAVAVLVPLKTTIAKIVLVFLWVLFFPNAPYILTDLIHLGVTGGVPLWYDLILILSFAFAGLCFGFVSLRNIEELLAIKSKLWRNVISCGLIYLSCFGIYLGRFLRWNSWDLFGNTQDLFLDIVSRIANPFAHAGTWAFTLLLGTMLVLVYFSYKVLAIPTEINREPQTK